MHSTALCLNLAGVSSECFRFYEALEAGDHLVFVSDKYGILPAAHAVVVFLSDLYVKQSNIWGLGKIAVTGKP
jgi:hypothetical protein